MFGTMSDQTVYTAVNLADSSDQFTVKAGSYLFAQYDLLDKLGYALARNAEAVFHICDADTGNIERPLRSTNVNDALTEALAVANWKIQDPVELIGGALTGGFGFDENQPH